MFLFHACNHALTPHLHQFTVLVGRLSRKSPLFTLEEWP
jgi:hypothetical protein